MAQDYHHGVRVVEVNDGNGFVTSLELEVKIDGLEME
jgi:hypothetical protein